MRLIDRYILRRFAANFIILFALLFLFAVGIDAIVNLDEFVKAAREHGDMSTLRRTAMILGMMLDFQGPRVFVFYAYLHGLVAIAAMGFTLAQMVRHRELVAILASGMSLHRLALPFAAAMLAVSLLQLANQELLLWRVAPLVIRDHADAGKPGVDEFPVPFTDDGRGLLQAPLFDPASQTLTTPTILVRDERGRTIRRITAEKGVWNEAERAWMLTGGIEMSLGAGSGADAAIERYPTELDPVALTIRHYAQFAAMLSLRQIRQMLQSEHVVDREALLRFRSMRFAGIAVNLCVLVMCLPCFLLREQASLLRQSLFCASLAVPAMIGAAIGMMLRLPGIPPVASVFLPALLLAPLAAARWSFLKT